MPTLKAEILGSNIEINFEEKEREKLLHLINNFKNRLSEFSNNNNGRISNTAIIFLAALKAEDQLEEIKNLLVKNKDDKNNIEKLNKEIVLLTDKVNKFKSINQQQDKNHSILIEEINNLENMLLSIQKKILLKNEDRY